MCALRHEQTHGAVALQLKSQRAVEFERRSQQYGGRNGLTQEVANHIRIVRVRAQLLPGSFEAHPVAPDGAIFNNEAANQVAGPSGVFVGLGHEATMGDSECYRNPHYCVDARSYAAAARGAAARGLRREFLL